MNTLGKILIVFVTVMSLGYATFIGVAALGGPNWRAMTAELNDFSFTKTGGAVAGWEVTDRVSGKQVASTKSLPEAISRAQTQKISQQRKRLQNLDAQIKAYSAEQKQEATAAKGAEPGIATRIQRLNQEWARLEQQGEEVTAQGASQVQAAHEIRESVESRRKDALRLETELSQTRVDRFRVNEQIQQLEQRLIRLQGQLARMKRRHQQLSVRVEEKSSASG